MDKDNAQLTQAIDNIMLSYIAVLARHHDDPEDLDYTLTQLSYDIDYVAEGIVEEPSVKVLAKANELQSFLTVYKLESERKTLEMGMAHALRQGTDPKAGASGAFDYLAERKKQQESTMFAAKDVTDATIANAKPATVVSTSRSPR